MVKPPTPEFKNHSKTVGIEIVAAVLCICGLIIAAALIEPKAEPQTWPRTGEWECTR
jgi:hypothetical protein